MSVNSAPSTAITGDRRGSVPAIIQPANAENVENPANSTSEESVEPHGTPHHSEDGVYNYPHGPVVNGQPVYPMVYSMVDGNGYPVNVAPGAPQSMVPTATYYIPAPVFSYPPDTSPNASAYFMGNGASTDGQQVIYTQCYPNAGAGPPGAAVYYPNGAPTHLPPGYNYMPANAGAWASSCACASCRSITPQQSGHPPTAPIPATAVSPRTPVYIGGADSEMLAAHRQSISSVVSPINGPQSPVIQNGGPTATPLSSRPGMSSDSRRRLISGANAINSRDGNDSLSSLGISDRKKRKMGYLNNILYKTEICRDYQQTGCCPRGKSCQFAHGGNEVHHPKNHPLYKTAFCFDFKKDGRCPRGDACFHVHHPSEMRDKPNRSRGMRGPRYGRTGRGSNISSKTNSPLVFTSRSRSDGSRTRSIIDGQVSGESTPRESLSGDALPSTSDVKNTMLLLQRLSSENTATLLKKMAEDDVLRGNPVSH